MRELMIVVALVFPLSSCATHSLQAAPEPSSYNRRELPPSDGLFTGPDGTWTIYRNDTDGADMDCNRVFKAQAGADKLLSPEDLARDLNLPVEKVNSCLLLLRRAPSPKPPPGL